MKEESFSLPGEISDLAYRTVFTAVIALFVFFEIFFDTEPELITPVNIITLIVISLVLSALLLLYHRVRLFLLPAVLIVGVILYLTVDKNEIRTVIESTLFALFVTGLVSFVLFMIIDRVMPLNCGLVVAGAVYLLVKVCYRQAVFPASPALFVFYVFAVIVRFSRERANKGDIDRLRKYMTFLFPFLTAFLVGVVLLPKPEKPISWEWVVRLYDKASEGIDKMIHGLTTRYGKLDAEYFTISFGMDEEMQHDNSKKRINELFEVTANGGVAGSLYLKGEVFNEFRDGIWRNTLDGGTDYVKSDTAETRLGIDRYDKVPYGSIARDAGVRIKFLDIVSPIVFTPAKFSSFTDISAKRSIHGENEHLLFSENVSYGSEYAVSFLQMNMGNTVFADYMNTPYDPDEKAYDGLEEYRAYVRKYYTSQPQIQDGVKDWLSDITRESGGEYDRLLALEEGLSGFTYELATEKLPPSVKSEGDFINWFLLEKQEGYCVHYATAFCILARYLGYPARIVQGYKADVSANQTVVITDENGHAWPEVYFEGKGWIPFEPTPGMSGERYAGWEVSEGRIKSVEAKQNDHRETAVEPGEGEESLKEQETVSVPLIMILAITGVAAVSLALLFAARLLLAKRRKARMSDSELYCEEFSQLQKVMKELGYERAGQETLAEFAGRADIAGFGVCTAVMENYLYGGRIPSKDDIRHMEECLESTDALMRESFGKMYFIHRFKLLIR